MPSCCASSSVEWSTWLALLCTMVGTGILQLPLTLKQGGWAAVALIIIVAVFTNATGRWLIRCLYEGASQCSDPGSSSPAKPRKRLADYASIGRAACGRTGTVVVHIFHKATLLGVTTIFLVLIAKFLLEGIGGGGEGFVPGLGHAGQAVVWQQRWGLVAAGIVLVPVVFLDTMRELTPLSLFGFLASLLCVVEITVFALIIQPVTLASATEYNLPVPEPFLNRSSIRAGGSVGHTYFSTSPQDFALAFSAITLSFGGHAVFPTIEKHMSAPSKFVSTFNAAYACLLLLYLLAAVMGFYAFGDITYSPILCNFPRSTSTLMGAVTAGTKLLVALHVISAYPILMNVLVSEIEEWLGLRGSRGGGVSGEKDTMRAPLLPLQGGPVESTAGKSHPVANTGDAETPGNPPQRCPSSGQAWRRRLMQTLLRCMLVGTTSAIAIKVPFFALLMELVGALCLTMMVFVLPVIFSFMIWGGKMGWGQKILGACILITGAVAGFIGTRGALIDIASSLAAGKHE